MPTPQRARRPRYKNGSAPYFAILISSGLWCGLSSHRSLRTEMSATHASQARAGRFVYLVVILMSHGYHMPLITFLQNQWDRFHQCTSLRREAARVQRPGARASPTSCARGRGLGGGLILVRALDAWAEGWLRPVLRDVIGRYIAWKGGASAPPRARTEFGGFIR
jgi:hypothetical protein